jgi:signal recognition particle subunit SEC65
MSQRHEGRSYRRGRRVARNALRNRDLHRAAEVLEQIEELVGGVEAVDET